MNHGVKCTECGSLAILYTKGEFAGLWECQNDDCGATDEHDHTGEDTRTYTTEGWPTSPDEVPSTETVEYYAVCGVPVNG